MALYEMFLYFMASPRYQAPYVPTGLSLHAWVVLHPYCKNPVIAAKTKNLKPNIVFYVCSDFINAVLFCNISSMNL
jgi:hypothetical protein